MNQRPMRGETTLAALQAAYRAAEMRRRALIICEQLDEGSIHAPGKQKLDALRMTLELCKRLGRA